MRACIINHRIEPRLHRLLSIPRHVIGTAHVPVENDDRAGRPRRTRREKKTAQSRSILGGDLKQLAVSRKPLPLLRILGTLGVKSDAHHLVGPKPDDVRGGLGDNGGQSSNASPNNGHARADLSGNVFERNTHRRAYASLTGFSP